MHDNLVEFAKISWRVNNLIYGINFVKVSSGYDYVVDQTQHWILQNVTQNISYFLTYKWNIDPGYKTKSMSTQKNPHIFIIIECVKTILNIAYTHVYISRSN